MNGATRPTVTNVPFNTPPNMPIRMATRIAATTAGSPPPRALSARMAMPPASATSEPTERSMPPAMMISVMPNAMMPV